jgi:predicted HAD superfamily Cof-like phosphohydrolase
MEYATAADSGQIQQVDALVDLLYFVIGTFVIMGFDPFNDSRLKDMQQFGKDLANDLADVRESAAEAVRGSMPGSGARPADRLYAGSLREWRVKDVAMVMDLIFDFMLEPVLEMQISSLRRIMDWALMQAAIVGADLYPYFLVVHDSNMAKLWPDGLPRYRKDGKIVKPNEWSSPKGAMETLMVQDLEKQIDEDEIPF